MNRADQFGPLAQGLDPTERCARLHSMQAIVRLTTGPRGERLADLLRRAERDGDALEPAAAVLGHLTPIDRRHVLTSFAALHRPAWGG